MTFIFEDELTGEIHYVYASDLDAALDIYESHTDWSASSDFAYVHVYVRIF